MAKGDKNKGKDVPSANTRKGNKKNDDQCNQVNSGNGVDDTATQSNTPGQASGRGNMGASPGESMRGYVPSRYRSRPVPK